jgi:hypothetical protein
MTHYSTALVILFIAFYSYAGEEEQEIEKISIYGQTPISPHGNEYYLLGSVQQIDSTTIILMMSKVIHFNLMFSTEGLQHHHY